MRANEGWDWAAWAHVLALNGDLDNAAILYWLNDSMIGPVNQKSFRAIVERVRASRAAIVGLTASHEFGWHLQSYFLAFKHPALQFRSLREFLREVVSLPTRERVIHSYEIPFTRNIEEMGLTTEALFAPNRKNNPTIHSWKQLLHEGFTKAFPSLNEASLWAATHGSMTGGARRFNSTATM